MLFACSCQHMLNTFPFIQRTEQVLIELDISAIEEYVIIIMIILLLYVEAHIFILETLEKLGICYRIMLVLLLFMHLLVVD